MALTRITSTGGEFCIIYWKNDTTQAIDKTYETDTYYNDVWINKTLPKPTRSGYTFAGASRATEYDTPSGEMEEGQFAIQNSGTRVFVRKSNIYSSIEVSNVQKILGATEEDAIIELNKPEVSDIIHIDALNELRLMQLVDFQ